MNLNVLPRNELRISITSLCNMKCVYCHNEGNNSTAELSRELIKKLVEKSLKFGLKSIRLTGGEPLLHKDINSICSDIKSVDSNLKISINTNGILIDKILDLINKNYIDRIVIGLDYFDGEISKKSPIGVPSKTILENIIKIKQTGVRVEIAKTYNDDLDNTISLTKWAIDNKIPIKIIEIVDENISENTTHEYLEMRDKLTEIFNLELRKNDSLNEYYGYINDEKVISFFQSHCRLRECSYCKNLHMRVTSTKKFKPCLLNSETEKEFDETNIETKLEESFKYLGIAPKVK